MSVSDVLGPTAYTLYSFTLIATSAATDITFTFASDPAFWDFDNVSVNVGAAPEPGSLALLALGGGVIAAFRRRRRQV